MAALIPLFLPQIIDTGMKLGIGISNAVQGDSSSVSLQIGRKVFTTKKEFNLGSLPPELRRKIILMAMEASKDLILPMPYFFDPIHPPTEDQLREMGKANPLNRESKHYRSIVGDRVSANGYPISTWRWAQISTEWRDVVRPVLWRKLDVAGARPYRGLKRKINAKADELRLVQSITLREGFMSTEDLYTILSDSIFDNLEQFAILPDYPTPWHQLISPVPAFPFGLQLLRTRKPTKAITFGFPLETTTNTASRQHLRTLHPPKLHLSFSSPTVRLFEELKDLVAETTKLFVIRYVPLRQLGQPQLFLCEPLQSFKRINLYLNMPRPRMIMTGPEGSQTLAEDPEDPGAIFITTLLSALENADRDVQERYKVFKVSGWETAGQKKKAAKIWPTEVLFDGEFDFDAEVEADAPAPKKVEEEVDDEEEEEKTPLVENKNYWDREMDLKLLGGFFNLKVESKKR